MVPACKVHKKCVGGFPPSRPIFSALQTSAYKLAKFFVSILTTNKYTVKGSFNFVSETVEQGSSNFIGRLDIDPPFSNIPFEETIEIYTNNIFKNKSIVHGLEKVNLRIFNL